MNCNICPVCNNYKPCDEVYCDICFLEKLKEENKEENVTETGNSRMGCGI